MKNFKIIAILIFVSASFFVVKAIGQESKFFQKADAGSKAVLQSNEDDKKFFILNSPEILSQNSVSTSSVYLTNVSCEEGLPLSARLALVRFLNDNNKVYEFNAGGYWPIASITKLITATVAVENIDTDKQIALTDQMVLAEGGAGNFKSGEIYKSNDLIKAMLLLSSNDAAEALAQDFGEDDFIGLMNKKTRELNLSGTVFFDPTGLSAKNQSTPNDIFKIMSYLYQYHPEILKITSQKTQVITELKSKIRKSILNINQFAGQANFIGGKTGFIDEAQENLVSLFMIKQNSPNIIQKEPVVIVVLGSQDRFEDTKKLLDCIQN